MTTLRASRSALPFALLASVAAAQSAGRFTQWDLPMKEATPYVVRVDRQRGGVWIGTGAADAVFRFDPQTARFTTYELPTRGALVRHLDVDPRTRVVWVAYGASPGVAARVARIEP